MSYKRGNIEFSKTTNLNTVYRDLLGSVHRRGWQGGSFRPIKGLSEDDFVLILEEIALASWHGDGRTTTIAAITEKCQRSGLQRILKELEEGAKSGVTRLLTAFYFRQGGHESTSGEKTFEFTHKSFGEYLTVLRIIRLVETIERQVRRRDKHPADGWDERGCLTAWAEVCGPTTLEEDLYRFVEFECQRRGAETAARGKSSLSR